MNSLPTKLQHHNLGVTVYNEPSSIGVSRSSSTSLTDSPNQPVIHSATPSYRHPSHLIPGKLETVHPDISLNSLSSTAVLAPPPPAPHGPRSPALLSVPSRTPSPEWPGGAANGSSKSSLDDSESRRQNGPVRVPKRFNSDDGDTMSMPSAKALGKRKLVEAEQRDRKCMLS